MKDESKVAALKCKVCGYKVSFNDKTGRMDGSRHLGCMSIADRMVRSGFMGKPSEFMIRCRVAGCTR